MDWSIRLKGVEAIKLQNFNTALSEPFVGHTKCSSVRWLQGKTHTASRKAVNDSFNAPLAKYQMDDPSPEEAVLEE